MALMSYIEYATTEDGSRYNWHHYSIIFQRKWHLFKGRNSIYVLELDGKKHLLFNGGYMSLNSNLTQIDIKISKMVKGVECSSARLCGPADESGHSFITVDVTRDTQPIFKILKCDHRKQLQLIED